jgi:amino acid adenylation domain-containing protein/non-ribosomal peptide synthase protein (TIGR01720 family)
MSDLAKTITGLSPEKRRLLDRVLRRQGVELSRSVILPQPRNPLGDPLTYAQQRLWFLDRLSPGSSFYNVSRAIRLRGAIDPAALSRVFVEVVRRHEVLHTHFSIHEGEPVQLVSPPRPWVLVHLDLRALPPAARQAEMLRQAAGEARRPFDLAAGAPLRAVSIELAAADRVVLLAMHHIVADGWSMEVMVREIAAVYAAFAAGRPSPLPELPVQYADFALWQRRWLSGEVLERQLAYWRQQLAGVAVLELATDRPRPPAQTFAGATAELELAAGPLLGELHAIARRQGATLFMLALAVCQALLARYSGQRDVAVGTPIAGRKRVELEALIGFFVNTLVLRTEVAGEEGFLDLLARVREVTLAAYAHQDVPFERLVGDLQPERDQSRSPLFQVMFGLQQTAGEPPAAIPGVRVEAVELAMGTAKFDLTLALDESSRGLSCAAEYNRDLFDAATIRRLLRHFGRLLEEAAADPLRPLGELPLLLPAERHALVAEWNDSGGGHLHLLHDLVAAQAARTPDAVAVARGERRLSYGELDRRANRLARHLVTLGVGPGVAVGLCFDRSPEMVVALLGALKAGGAYLPLDPTYPEERLAFMMADCGLLVHLTEEGLADALPQSWGFTIRLDADWGTIADESAEPPPVALDPDDLAYVIYTSGSTGRPKAVMVPHRGLGNLAREQARAFRVAPGSRVLQFASLSFDASISEIAMALTSGATLHLAGRGALLPGAELIELLRDERITTVTLPPSALAALPAAELPDLHTLVVAGEACPPEVARRWGQGRRLVNAYGPTEATVCGTLGGVGATAGDAPRLSIGRPIGGARLYLLERELERGLEPVPLGVRGEVYLGGIGLARGYWGRPELTAAAFLPHPFGAEPGARLYRTGDVGRLLAEGEVELLGRADSQVKLRGFRIELGEIEAALAEHPAVREAAVVLREDRPGERRIVAYCVPLRSSLTREELRGALQARLAPHMIPAFFVVLEALPRLPGGKVDRRALPPPEVPAEAADAYVAPRNRAEEALAAIWRQVLRLERVSVQQNFFEVGGDSILGIQVVFRAGQEGLRLTPGQLFEHPTIAGLAAVAERAVEAFAEAGPVVGPLPLTPIQLWLLEQEMPHPEHFNQSLLFETGLRVEPAILDRAVEVLLRHHDALRMRFLPPAAGGGAWQQRDEAPGGATPFTQVDLAALPPARRSAAIESSAADLQASLDLAAGPLLRVALFTAPDDPGRLFLAVHHLVIDGVSWRILLADLETVYGELARGAAPELPAKTTSFQHWAQRVAELARSPALAAEAGYWLGRLEVETPALPLDRTAGGNTVASARAVLVALDAEETRALLQEVPRAYRTQINDVLLAALVEALAPWAGGRRLLLDLEGHGREEIAADVDVSRTVGYFTSIFPVVLDLAGAASPGESLKRVKEELRRIPRRGFGFGLLRYLGDEAVRQGLARSPRAGLVFNYLGQLDQVVEGSSLFRPARESAGPVRHPLQPRPYLLELSASVRGGRLSVAWIYSENRHLPSTIEALGRRFLEALQGLIAHCLSPAAGGYTPSDFPLARLDPRQLDRIVDAAGGRIEDLYPLSPMQQGMLFQTLQAPGSGVYIGQLSLDVNVDLNVPVFERAWSQVIERHAILRTGFFWRDLDAPVQAVFPSARLPLDHQDWRHLAEADVRSRLAEHLAADRRRGFDLSAPPLLRLALLRLAEARYRLVFSSHHATFDGWSWSILLREIFALYEAGLRGTKPELQAVAPYRAYIAWLQGEDMTAAEGFWRRDLAGFAEPTPLPDGPLARLREAAAPLFVTAWTRLSPEATAALRTFARRQQLTFNTLVQAAWSLVLHRYSGEEDVMFGAVTSGRSAPLPAIEAMVGLFINTLPVRARVDPRAGLAGWLRALQERQAEARRYEHSPLLAVHGWSEVPRGKPLFESLLTFENYPVDESVQEQIGTSLRPSRVEFTDRTNYPLTVVAGARGTLDLEILYDARRFDAALAAGMLGYLESLFTGMLATPDGAVGDLPRLAASERRQILAEWSRSAPPATGEPFLDLFETQAARAPDALAVTSGDRALTYAELAARAHRLARHLRRTGVERDVPVGICLERSPEMIVALLGVLAAGGGYVPLDPTYPQERLAFMMDDCALPVILTEQSLADALPQSWGLTLRLDADGEAIAAESAEPLPVAPDPDDLAYVIYTSGSTGRPKGVMVPHRGLGNLARAQGRAFRVAPGSRVLQFASLSFDASIAEIAMALAAGAMLCLAGRGSRLPGAELIGLLRDERITTVTLPPSALAALPAAELPDLHTLVVAGEACDPAVARRWGAGRRLINAYGPTEATVCVSFAPFEDGLAEPLARLPIGRPLAGVDAYLLDRELEPVPAGARGEIYAGGVGVARGYRGRPDLTAAAFLPHPWSDEPGARLYRTSDVGRLLGDGSIDLLGRADRQVKLRGFRIELEEIEAALRSHGGVRDAGAALLPSPAGDALAAWIVLDERPAASADELRQLLRDHLPEHMIPLHVTPVAALPLTPSGKLDRNALVRLAVLPLGADALPEPPRTPVEELVAGIFAEVLGVERVGVHASFFDLGGHSLLATQAVSRMRAVFGLELPIMAVFEAPTARGLAARLEAARTGGGGLLAPPIVPLSRQQGLPLSFAQQRLWFLDQLDPASAAYNLAAAVRLEGELSVPALAAAVSEIVRRHEALRTTFEASGGEPLQRIAPPGAVTIPAVDLGGLAEPACRRAAAGLLRQEAQRPFDLARGPLLRVLRLGLAPAEHAVLLTLHHIVGDGWSMGLLVRELGLLYGALLAGRPSPLPELAVQYADFAGWQRRWLAGEVLAGELAFWRDGLAGAPPALDLPLDRAPPPGARPAPGEHPLHGPPGGVPDAPRAADGGERPLRRDADRRAQPGADRGPDRPLRQHPGAAVRPPRRPELPRPARAGARLDARRLRPPGPALRAAGRGAAAGARPQPDAALPGPLLAPEHAAAAAVARRPARPAGGGRRERGRQAGPEPLHGRGGGRPQRLLQLRDGALRPQHDPAARRALRAPARGGLRLPRSPAVRALRHRRDGAPRDPPRVERHRERRGGGRAPGPPARRDPGRARPRRAGGDGRGRGAQLRRARAPRQPAGALPPRRRGRAGGAGGRRPRALARHGQRPAGDPEGRRRLRAARSRLPRGPLAPHGGRRARRDVPHRGAPGRQGASAGRPGAAGGAPGCRLGGDLAPAGRRSAAPRRARQPRLRDLHLRLDGAAQGGPDPAPGGRQLPRLDAPAAGARARRRAALGDHALLRHRRPGDLPAPDAGGAHRPRQPGDRRRRQPPRRSPGLLGGDRPPGDARHLAVAPPGGLARSRAPAGPLRRRGAAARARPAPARQGARAVESLRPHRDHDLVRPPGGRGRAGRGRRRPPDRQHADAGPRPSPGARAGGGDRRAPHRRPGPLPRLPRHARADGGEARPRPLRRAAGGPALPDGGPRAPPAGRRPRRRRPHRPAGEGPRLPHRARRGGGGARRPSGRAGGGGRGARRPARRPRPGGLRGAGGRRPSAGGGAARAAAAEAAGLHDAGSLRPSRGAPPDPQRQGGPRRPAGSQPRRRGRAGRPHGRPRRPGARPPRHLAGGPRHAADRRPRQLLRARGPLAAGGAADRPPAPAARAGGPPDHPVPARHDRGLGGGAARRGGAPGRVVAHHAARRRRDAGPLLRPPCGGRPAVLPAPGGAPRPGAPRPRLPGEGARHGRRAAPPGRGDGGPLPRVAAPVPTPRPLPSGRLVAGRAGGVRDGPPAAGSGGGGRSPRPHRSPRAAARGRGGRGRGRRRRRDPRALRLRGRARRRGGAAAAARRGGTAGLHGRSGGRGGHGAGGRRARGRRRVPAALAAGLQGREAGRAALRPRPLLRSGHPPRRRGDDGRRPQAAGRRRLEPPLLREPGRPLHPRQPPDGPPGAARPADRGAAAPARPGGGGSGLSAVFGSRAAESSLSPSVDQAQRISTS